MLKSIKDIKDWKGKKVLLRVDFNVPVENSLVVNDFRIKKTIPTLDYLVERGAKIIMVSHMSGNEVDSLAPVVRSLSGYKIKFLNDYFTAESKQALDEMSEGDIVLFENLRNNPGEKENDEEFARLLAEMAEIYVNDAFAVSHRRHASLVGVTKFLPSYAGILFLSEVENLSVVLDPPRPFLFILGGAKIKTKLPLAKQFSNVADFLVLGGALSNEFFQESGVDVGRSLVSTEDFDLSGFNMESLVLPVDLKVTNEKHLRVSSPDKIEKDERVVDIGPKTIEKIRELAEGAKFILWNGPVGEYKEGFKETSLEIARILSESGAQTVIGGGDTLSAVSEINVLDKLTFVSTAGGAMLDFLSDGTLPGIEALRASQMTNSK